MIKIEYWPAEEAWDEIFKHMEEDQWISEYKKWKNQAVKILKPNLQIDMAQYYGIEDLYQQYLKRREGQLEMQFAWEEVRDILNLGETEHE